jgi:hypothetical protein
MRRSAVTRLLSRHRPPALIIVLVAVLTGLGVGVLLGERGSTALAPNDEPVPSVRQSAEPSETAEPTARASSPAPEASPPAAVEATPEPAPTPPPLSGQLRHVATLADPDQSPTVLAAWRGGFIALGLETVWTSADGQDWQQADAHGLDGGHLVELVERVDGTLLVLGYMQTSPLGGVFRAWTSENSTQWAMTDLGLTDYFIVRDLAHGPRGYVLAGREPSDEPALNNEGLWFSADGTSWQVTHQPGEFQSISSVAAGPEGFVAVGQQDWSTNPSRAYVLASSDGVQWFEADPSDAALSSTGSLWGIAPLGPDWLAAPSASGSELRVLRSATGLTWEVASSLTIDPPAEAGFVAEMFGDGVRVLSDVPNAEFLWASTDGVQWHVTEVPVEAPGGGGQIRAATARGVTVVLVGGRVYAGTTSQ